MDLALDCVNATLYWCTSLSVELAHLNGRGHRTLQRLRPYSARYILGLTLDLKGGDLFWVLMQADRFLLYSSKLGDFVSPPRFVVDFSTVNPVGR